MSISSLIREEVKNLAYAGEDIKVRELSRKYNCSPSLVVKNIYKVEEKENLKHLTKYGVKGKVNLLIIDFEGEHLNNREDTPYNIKDTPSSNITISKKIKSEKQSPSLNLNECSRDNKVISERKDKCSPKENLKLESNPSKCLPSLAPPNNNHSLSLTPPNNNRSPQKNSLSSNNPSECSLFNVHQFKKEKEKFSYNLLKEKEKNKDQKFINKFLGFQDLEILDIYKYQKEILKIYLKYGGRLRESDIKYGKGILYYATPKQFEAILLKVIREKKGEIPPISYIYRVSERMDLKNRERKQTPKLFKRKNYDDGIIKNIEGPTIVQYSYMGLTGEEADRLFFGY